MSIVFLVLMLVSLALFIFLVVKTAKAWGGLQTTMLFFIFFSTWVFLFSAAGVARLRIGWIKAHDKFKLAVEKLQDEETRLKYGDLNSTSKDDEALIPLLGKLSAATADRGRVWRDATAQPQQGGEFLLDIPPAKPAAAVGGQAAPVADGAAAPANADATLPTDLVVYAFHVNPNQPPAVYLGEFLVVNSAGTKATLRATSPMPSKAMEFLKNNGDKTWTIFELMPVDDHSAFAASGSKKSDDEVFGRMDEDAICSLLQIDKALLDQKFDNARDPNYAKAELLRSYLQDGKEAPADVLPANEWYLVEFLAPYEVNVDSEEERVSTDGGFYDLSGRTVDARLKRGKDQAKVKYSAGDKALVTRKGAEDDQLIEKKIAKIVKRVYARTLNSYEFAFRDTKKRTVTTGQQIVFIQRETDIVTQANTIGRKQIALRQAHRQNLDKDTVGVQKEVDVSTAEVNRLESELSTLESKIKDSYQSMQKMHKTVRSKQLGDAAK